MSVLSPRNRLIAWLALAGVGLALFFSGEYRDLGLPLGWFGSALFIASVWFAVDAVHRLPRSDDEGTLAPGEWQAWVGLAFATALVVAMLGAAEVFRVALPIGENERDQWLSCMKQAMVETIESEELRAELEPAFFRISPREAAFFSSILPAPKQRYTQYCQGTLKKWTEDKLDRILKIMLDRQRLTQEEYDQAMATPLTFVKDGSETEAECLERTRRAIKRARPTNPMRK